MLGEFIVQWTARLGVACYIARLWIDVSKKRDASAQRLARWFWTVGCGLFLLHMAAAFHFQHDWSHAAAWEHVRQRTLETVGWSSGIGLYINYAFVLLWVGDAICWWWLVDWPKKRWPYRIVQAVFAFLMIQATAVFGPPFWRPVVIVVALLLVVLPNRKAPPN